MTGKWQEKRILVLIKLFGILSMSLDTKTYYMELYKTHTHMHTHFTTINVKIRIKLVDYLNVQKY